MNTEPHDNMTPPDAPVETQAAQIAQVAGRAVDAEQAQVLAEVRAEILKLNPHDQLRVEVIAHTLRAIIRGHELGGMAMALVGAEMSQ